MLKMMCSIYFVAKMHIFLHGVQYHDSICLASDKVELNNQTCNLLPSLLAKAEKYNMEI